MASEGAVAAEGAIDVGADAAADATEATAETAEAGADASETSADAAESAESSTEDTSAESEGESCATNSFTAQTGVLLASGKVIPISQVKAGDVVANAPAGESSAAKSEKSTVSKLIVTKDDAGYTEVSVKSGDKHWTIKGTAFHLYWDATTNSWTEADQLKVGDRLQSADGQSEIITAVHSTELASAPYPVTYNLTVNGLHTYYISGNGISVLVHNCGEEEQGEEDQGDPEGAKKMAQRTFNTLLNAGTNGAMNLAQQRITNGDGPNSKGINILDIGKSALIGGVGGYAGSLLAESGPALTIFGNAVIGGAVDFGEGMSTGEGLANSLCAGAIGFAAGAEGGAIANSMGTFAARSEENEGPAELGNAASALGLSSANLNQKC
jgi:hypothetical protein